MNKIVEIFTEFLKLGLTSFGGPSAHIAFFRRRFVETINWVDEKEFAALMALTQFLPGPGSSQLGMAIGWKRGGIMGSLAAFLGFTLPSALVMIGFAIGVMKFGTLDGTQGAGWIRGLQIAVIAVVANAVWGMAKSLCTGKITTLIALGSAAAVLGISSGWNQIGVIIVGGLLGWILFGMNQKSSDEKEFIKSPTTTQRSTLLSASLLVIFFILLALTPLMSSSENSLLQAFSGMYRSGSLVFGGGHVVLPLLSQETVDPGWLSDAEFSAGYGAVQAVPGPLFTIATYLGAVLKTPGGLWLGALVGTIGIFLPGWLLTLGTLPFWEKLRSIKGLQNAMAGTNAAVVGLLGAALYNPVWTKAITQTTDVVFLLGIVALLLVLKLPPWMVMIAAAVAGGLIW